MDSRGVKVLLTGANGFVGTATAEALLCSGFEVLQAVRRPIATENMVVGNLDESTDWHQALNGCDVVVHCAARVHVMHESAVDALSEFRKVNVLGTLNLARQAVLAGVKRFVFLSSIKVNGETTQPGRPFQALDSPAPEDAYGISKAEAEAGLRKLSRETGLEVVIIRPPLVYGPGMKGNFLNLSRWVARGFPLPLGAVKTNRRSFVALDNLVDLILTCVSHPRAAHQTFLVSDGDDLSTAELLRRIGKTTNRPARLLPVPVSQLSLAATLLGKKAIAQRLLGSLQVDISQTCALLNWTPPVSVNEGLQSALTPAV